jgi:periplasmic protein TonB
VDSHERPTSRAVSVRPDSINPSGMPDTRLSRSLGISVVCHAVGLALLALIAFAPPDPAPDLARFEPLPVEIVWLPDPGPGGGGGGGGNQQPDPPAPVEVPGEDPISLPVEIAPAPVPEPDPPPDPEPRPIAVSVPAVAMAAAATMAPGVLTPGNASESLGRGTGPGAGDGDGDGIGEGRGPGLGPGDAGGTGGGIRQPGGGVTTPVALLEVRPDYTTDAMRARIQGEVWVQCVVRPDGTCSDLQVVRSLDARYGLDEQALKAASQWRFAPGTLGGEPVPVRVVIQLDFALR